MIEVANMLLAQGTEPVIDLGSGGGFFGSAAGRWLIVLVVFGLLALGVRWRKSVMPRLFAVQRNKWFRIGASVFVIASCGSTFTYLSIKAASLETQRQDLRYALHGPEQAFAVRSLLATGEVRLLVNDVEYLYGGEHIKRGLNLYLHKNADIDPARGIAAPEVLVEDLLRDHRPAWAWDFLSEQAGTTRAIGAMLIVWLLLIIWINMFVPFLLVLVGVSVLSMVVGFLGWGQGPWVVSGIGVLTFTFVLLSRAFLMLFDSRNQILSVAHTLIREAGRQRISLAFIVLLLVLLPLLPTWLDPAEPLRYRIQSFISNSMRLTFGLAACMTLVLSCATVAFEIRDRQIWHLATKPMARFNYLMGKWLGLGVLNIILLSVSGVAIMMYVQYIRTEDERPGLEWRIDRVRVTAEVLTARTSTRPTYRELTPEQLEARYVQSMLNREQDPDAATAQVERQEKQRIQEEELARQRSIPPDKVGVLNEQTYVFDGLQGATAHQSHMMLRFRYHMLAESDHERYPVEFIIHRPDGRMQVWPKEFSPTLSHTLPIQPQFVDDEGRLTVTVRNMYEPTPQERQMLRGALSWEKKDFELLHKVDSFEMNFARALLMIWVKLAFLAVLGVACATFLSFPVACLLSFTIFLAGIIGPFLVKSLETYYLVDVAHIDKGNLGHWIQWAWRGAIKGIATVVSSVAKAFGEFNPRQSLVEGRYIPWWQVLVTFFKIGVLWCGFFVLIGWLVFRKRELATYSGQG